MKILLVIVGLGMGGAEHVVCNLADSLVKSGYKVKIAYLIPPVLVKPQDENIELISIGLSGASGFFKSYMKLRKIIQEFRPDVVHSHMFHSNVLSRLLRLTVKVPKLISTAHSVNEGGKLRMLAYRYTDFLADITTNVSKEAVNQFVRKKAAPASKIIAIPNGIDTCKFFYSSESREKIRFELDLSSKKMLLAVGRLDVQKDYPNLLHAIAKVKTNRKDFKLFIAGDGPLRESLLKLTDNLGINEYVSFLGVRKDIPALMCATDVFVLSSAWEGFGLVVGEAMACERVVVATDCGGVKEVVGNSGILVEPGNSLKLAECINQAISLTSDKASSLGAAARKHIVENYSLSKNVNSYLELYRK